MLRRGDQWVLGPHAPYETTGDIPNVVFPCGALLDQPSGELRVYYGAADTCVGVLMAKVAELRDWLYRQPAPATLYG